MAALSVSDISNINTRMRAPGTTTFDHRRWAPPAQPFDPSTPSPPLVLHIEFYKLDLLLNIFRENILYFFISMPYYTQLCSWYNLVQNYIYKYFGSFWTCIILEKNNSSK